MTMNRMLRTVLMVTLSMALALGLWGVMPAQRVAAAICTSTGSGDWSNSATWSGCDDGVPGAGDDIIIQAGHTVTVDASAEVNDITLQGVNSGTRLTLDATLTVHGTLNGDDTTFSTSLINGSGVLVFVGTSRALFGPQWTANTPGWNLEIALDPGAIGTASTNIKAGDILISSGTFEGLNVRPDRGTTTPASLTIAAGAKLVTTGISRTASGNTALVTNNGTLETTGLIRTDSLVNNGMLEIIGSGRINDGTALNNFGTIVHTQALGFADTWFIATNGTNGVVISRGAQLALGDVTVTMKGNQQCDTDDSAVQRCFEIESANPLDAGSGPISATLSFSAGELNGSTCADIKVWHWQNNDWEELASSDHQCTTEPYSVKAGGITSLSPFTLRSASKPTTVVLSGLSAASPFAVLAVGLLAAAGLVVLRKRK